MTFPLDNWDFETGDFSYWQAEGTAFDNQPVRGDVITSAHVQPVTLGGDYWDVPFAIGHHGDYWVGSAENPLGDEATGTLTSLEFPLRTRYIHFLVSGTEDSRAIRVELQLREEQYRTLFEHAVRQFQSENTPTTPATPTTLATPITLRSDEGFVVWCAATGHNSEVMRREIWDLTELLNIARATHVQLHARIKIIDASESGHINIDHVQFSDVLPEPETQPVWGFADLSCHPMAHLSFGGKLLWGKPSDPISKIERCNGTGHGGGLLSGRVLHSIEAENAATSTPSRHPSCCWPSFTSKTHQEMQVEWLYRAYEGGLRLICAYATNNQLLEHLMRAMPLFPIQPKDDMQSVLEQTHAMKQFAILHADWMSIALSPGEARHIIMQGKLAVVLSVAVDQLGGWQRESDCTNEQVSALVQNLFEHGIRMIAPIHGANNVFGGCALYQDTANSLNYYLQGEYFSVEDGEKAGIHFRLHERPEKVIFGRWLPRKEREAQALAPYLAIPHDHGHMNTQGLTTRGRFLLTCIMHQGMLIDVEHMSQKSLSATLEMAEHCRYPVIAAHTSFRELVRQKPSELAKTAAQVERIRRLGGMLAPTIYQEDVCDVGELVPHLTGKLANTSFGSSSSWAQAYLYARELMGGKGIAISTNANGLTQKPGPRFNSSTNAARRGEREDVGTQRTQGNGVRYVHYDHATARRARELRYSGPMDILQVPLSAYGDGKYDINVMGFAHYGMLPDFLQDGKNIGLTADDLATLFRSAEDFLQLWETCERQSSILKVGSTNTP